MNLGEQFEFSGSRSFKIFCGVVLLLIAVLLGFGGAVLGAKNGWHVGSIASVLVFVSIAWGLGILGVRVLLSATRVG